ncbi:TPA: hypothetical protein DDW35_13000, partial [Candidatus Sumerlaeota bacterium]|nr:hypothetical protein [Candidatus Sumerlaeota bacterium]
MTMSQPECVNSIAGQRGLPQWAWARLLSFFCVALLGVFCLTPALAGSFDLVLLIDESGSMMTTDPHGARKDAAELFLRLCNAKHRVEIAGFATDVRLLTNLQPMGPGATRDAALKEAKQILSSGQRTDIEKALRSARDVLMRSSSPDTTKVVLLMTDGEVDLKEKSDPQKKGLEEKSIEAIRGPLLSKYLQDNIKLYTIAFSPESDFNLLSSIANATGGMCARGDKEDELQKLFLRLFEEIEKPQTAPIKDGAVLIDGSVHEATFLIAHTPQETSRVSVTPPDGTAVNRAAAERMKNYSWFSSPSFDLVTVTDPKGGKWKIEPHGKDADSRVMLITDMTLELEDFAATSRGDEQTSLLAALKSKGTTVDAPEILGVLTMEATLTARTRTVIPLIDDGKHNDGPANNGLFGGAYRTPSAEGTYDLEIIARTPTLERRIVRSVRVSQPWFRFQLEREAIAPGEELPLKATVDREKITAGLMPEFIASVRQPDGQLSEIPLAQALDNLYSASFDSTKTSGAYRATITGSVKLADGKVLRDTIGPLEFMVRAAVGPVAVPVVTPPPTPAPTPVPAVTPAPAHHETPEPTPTPEVVKVVEKVGTPMWVWISILVACLTIIGLLVYLVTHRSGSARVAAPSMEALRERASQIRQEDYDTTEALPAA